MDTERLPSYPIQNVHEFGREKKIDRWYRTEWHQINHVRVFFFASLSPLALSLLGFELIWGCVLWIFLFILFSTEMRVRTQIYKTFFISCTGLFVQFILFGQRIDGTHTREEEKKKERTHCYLWLWQFCVHKHIKYTECIPCRTCYTIVNAKLNWYHEWNRSIRPEHIFDFIQKENWITFEPIRKP